MIAPRGQVATEVKWWLCSSPQTDTEDHGSDEPAGAAGSTDKEKMWLFRRFLKEAIKKLYCLGGGEECMLLGFVIGLFLGVFVGVFAIGLLNMAARAREDSDCSHCNELGNTPFVKTGE